MNSEDGASGANNADKPRKKNKTKREVLWVFSKKCWLLSHHLLLCEKSVSFGFSKLRWRAQSSSRSSLSRRLRSFISSVAHMPRRKYALWSSFGHASLGNSKPAVSQRHSNRCSNSCSLTRCVLLVMTPRLVN